MTLRAVPARWFEAVVPRPSVARSVELLASTGKVQPEKDRTSKIPLPDYSAMAKPLEVWRGLRQRYLGYWPAPRFEPTRKDLMLERRMDAALAKLQAWVDQAAPHVQKLEAAQRDRHELKRLADFLNRILDRHDIDLGAVGGARAPLASALLVVADHAPIPEMSEHIVVARADGEGFSYLLTLGADTEVRNLAQTVGGREARVMTLPPWLAGTPPEALSDVTRRLADLDWDMGQAHETVAELTRQHDLAVVLGELRRLEWLTRQLEDVPVSEYLARITGWTTTAQPDELRRPLEAAGIPVALNFLPAPRGLQAPTLTENPPWARPFELFVHLLGTPGRYEADPTLLLAIIAPLLFGYMFGDVGQGAVLVAAGLVLRRRYPNFGMLIAGGLFAMVFGVLFGSVFCREGLLHPLWVSPLQNPLLVLAIPLGFGAFLVLLGLLLGGLEEHWAGRTRAWLETEAGLIAIYLGLLASFVNPTAGLTVAAIGATWFVLGPALLPREERHESLGAHAGELPERLLQMGVNTLSFARVGAFAIAHAGLAAAVTSLAIAAGGVLGVFVTILGNALILVLEGMVVSIQTTRLILFEFFVRFLRAEGRPFRALPPPSAT